MIGRVLGDKDHARNGRRAVVMRLQRGVPEQVRIVLAAGGESWHPGDIASRAKASENPTVTGEPSGALAFAGERQRRRRGDCAAFESFRIGFGVHALQHQERETPDGFRESRDCARRNSPRTHQCRACRARRQVRISMKNPGNCTR